jgi:gliding motility-associated-like protein
MKKILIIFALFSGFNSLAQSSNVNADCIDAIALCNVPTFTFYQTSGIGTYTDIPNGNNISNPQTNPGSSNSGCLLSGELNPQWLMLTVGNAGTLEFVFGASNSSNPQAGFYDWAMWKYSPSACSDILNNTLAPVRCNWNASSTGGTGIAATNKIPTGGVQGNYEPPLTVAPCDQFLICISNFSGVNALVGFLNLGTASLSCDPNCLSVTNASLCYGGNASIVAANSGTLTQLSYSMNPGGFISNTPTFVVSPPASGTYTVYATGLNIANIPITQTAVSTVTVYSSPTVSPTFTLTTCTNTFSAYDLNLAFVPSVTPMPSYTINWSTPSGQSTSNLTSASGLLLPGPYSATITSEGGCQAISNFTMPPQPQPAPITLSPAGPVYSITCLQPTVTITALVPSYDYTWTNQIVADKTGSLATFHAQSKGTWTITAVNPASGCMSTKVITVGENTLAPTSTINPLFQTINCTIPGVKTITATTTPSVNVTQTILSSLGGPFSSTSYSMIYVPGYPDTYTHVAINNVNGCVSQKIFTVASSDEYPKFDLQSTPPNYTLGCSSKSVITINMLNGVVGPGGTITFTLLSPTASPNLPGGKLSAINVYTSVNTPGTWTAIGRADVSGCETRLPFSVLSNTFSPSLDSMVIPRTVLDCNVPRITLRGISLSPNIKYTWSFKGPGSQPGDTLTVYANFQAPNTIPVDNYSLTIEDNNNLCRTNTVVPIVQNIFPPVARIGSTGSITCITSTIELTNQSVTGIPNTFPTNSLVIGAVWQGPSPQIPAFQKSSYVGHYYGDYTLTAKDLNNGCTSKTVITIGENKVYPILNNPVAPVTPSLGCGEESAKLTPIVTTSTTNLTYSWTAVPGATVTGDKTATLSANLPGVYRLLVTDKTNGCSSTTNMKIDTGTLTASFVAEPEIGYAPMNVTFVNNSFASTATTNISNVWSLGNGKTTTTSVLSNITTQYTQPGTYTITLFARRGICIDSTYRVIEVQTPSGIKVPNIFTPNGDGVNDVFFLQEAKNLVEINAKITDRWGRVVYEIKSDKGQIAWDGRNMLGEEADEGVYLFIITARGHDGIMFEEKGNITLLR